MMRRRMLFGCACLLAGGGIARAQQHPQFGYSGASGPLHWGACAAGRNQSPVNLSWLAAQAFERALGFANHRPVRPVNARLLLQARGG